MIAKARSRAESTAGCTSALRDAVALAARNYLSARGECAADSLYALMLAEMEAGLLTEVLRHCEGNQSHAAAVLGINRATLRKKLDALVAPR